MDDKLSKKEIYCLYKQIISGVYKSLKQYNFIRKGSVNFYRFREELYQ